MSDTPTCPYCGTEVVTVVIDDRYVNGMRPADAKAKGCEFCNPTVVPAEDAE